MIGEGAAIHHPSRVSSLMLCETPPASLTNAAQIWARGDGRARRGRSRAHSRRECHHGAPLTIATPGIHDGPGGSAALELAAIRLKVPPPPLSAPLPRDISRLVAGLVFHFRSITAGASPRARIGALVQRWLSLYGQRKTRLSPLQQTPSLSRYTLYTTTMSLSLSLRSRISRPY